MSYIIKCVVMTKSFSQIQNIYFITTLNVKICNVLFPLYFNNLSHAVKIPVNIVIFKKYTICVILSIRLWFRYSYIVCFTMWAVVGFPCIVISGIRHDYLDNLYII